MPERDGRITTLLLDADGVTQRSPEFRTRMAPLLGGRATVAQLLDAERPSLVGGRDLRVDLATFIAEHGLDTTPDALLEVWLDVVPDPAVLELIGRVRASGVPVYLATNQQPIRGAHMFERVGYADHVDGQFHSFQLGVAKPDPEFFRRIIARLDADPAATLFVDDLEPNVLAAREAGLVAEHHQVSDGAAGVRAILERHGLLTA